jgi:hypothetical protein
MSEDATSKHVRTTAPLYLLLKQGFYDLRSKREHSGGNERLPTGFWEKDDCSSCPPLDSLTLTSLLPPYLLSTLPPFLPLPFTNVPFLPPLPAS